MYKVCAAIYAKYDAIPWGGDSSRDINQVWQESQATLADVPYHLDRCKVSGISD